MYRLRTPVNAVQYTGENDAEAIGFVKAASPPGISFENVPTGTLHFHYIRGGGSDLRVTAGQWVIEVGGKLLVMDDIRFRELFEAE
ncbi:hypothetical protein ABZS66_00240 [Dactylosporangium sp. NPDC005572]|uniref:hypothetical protein n=1 Tax=Dactylosporangium sp. NPDC005572 TaxID=3156889 RepID=UPI00339F3201